MDNGKKKIVLLFFPLLALGVFVGLNLRLASANNRPFHTDEAIQATIAATWLDSGTYDYDPNDYHGPTLPLATAGWYRLAGHTSFTEPTKSDARTVAVFFGVLLLMSPLIFLKELGFEGASIAILLAGTSGYLSYYGGYLIHESLFVLLTFVTLWSFYRFVQSEGGRSRQKFLCASAVSAGLTLATKETVVIHLLIATVAALVTAKLVRQYSLKEFVASLHIGTKETAAFVSITAGVVLLLVTNFLRDWSGTVSFVTFPITYLSKGTTGADDVGHVHSAFFYVERLLWFRDHPVVVFSEAMIPLTALIGGGLLRFFSKRRGASIQLPAVAVFLACFVMFQLIFLSLLPYKTPWLMMSAWYALILFIGVVYSTLMRLVPRFPLTVTAVVLPLLCTVCLYPQAKKLTGPLAADVRNPWVYGHALPSVEKLASDLRLYYQLIERESGDCTVQVISRDYWPLPWFWRNLEKIGYQETLPADWQDVDLLVLSADVASEVDDLISNDRLIRYYGLLPERPLALVVSQEAHDLFLEERSRNGGRS